jgi:glucose 1-dehydrogenase
MNPLPLKGRTAAITGSNSGIGRAIACELAVAGADIAISYHSDREGAEEVTEEIREMGRRAIFGQVDTADPDSVSAYFASVASDLDLPDILVNNAGIDGETTPVAEMEIAGWDAVMAVNLRGPFLCIRRVLPHMISRGNGCILNISSVHDTIGWAGHTAYCASKAGLSMMTRSLALELLDSGVRVVGLSPGAIRTPINQDVWQDPENMADLKSKIPIGRIGEPEEIAQMARFLVSDEASYVTGVTITVDGGMTAYPSFTEGG